MQSSGHPISFSPLSLAGLRKARLRYLTTLILLVTVICMLAISNRIYAEGLVYETQTIKIANAEYQYSVLKGYTLSLVNNELLGPRMITSTARGDLLIGSKTGHVYQLNAPYTKAQTLLMMHDYPHSIAVRDQYIFIAQTNGLYRARLDCTKQKCTTRNMELYAKLPGGEGHTSRTVKISADGRIFVSLGISGNCSDEYLDATYPFEKQKGGIAVLDESRKPPVWKPYATGLRNPVGYDWNPFNGLIYSSNNGPDHLGFEVPREYFSEIREGSFHGMPWFQLIDNKIVRDPCIQTESPRKINEVTIPVTSFPARNAPMGVRFISRDFADERLRGNAIVALHGSWATKPDAAIVNKSATRRPPKLVMVRFDGDRVVDVVDFLTGFQEVNGYRWARPMDIVETDSQNLYFTSDGGIQGLYAVRFDHTGN